MSAYYGISPTVTSGSCINMTYSYGWTSQTQNWISATPGLYNGEQQNLQQEMLNKFCLKECIVKKGDVFLVAVHGGVPVAFDTEKEALAEARRLAKKNDDAVYVFKPYKTIQPKPVDLEEVDS